MEILKKTHNRHKQGTDSKTKSRSVNLIRKNKKLKIKKINENHKNDIKYPRNRKNMNTTLTRKLQRY